MRKIIRGLSVIFNDFYKIMYGPLPKEKKSELSKAYINILFGHVFSKKKQIRFLGYTLDTYSYYFFYRIFREIFVNGCYFSPLENEKSPKIIDCGANIGMATLYFKWLWPDAHIESFEPDPKTFELLQKNIKQNKLKNVTCFNKAISDTDGMIDFYTNIERLGSPRMSAITERGGGKENKKIEIESLNLYKYLNNKDIALLKMDIEGAEYAVIKNFVDHDGFKRIKELHVEYHHNIPNQEHSLSEFIRLVEQFADGERYMLESEIDFYTPPKLRQQDILIKIRKNNTDT